MRELLTVELVPKTAWYKNVRSQVSREEWERLKRITFKRANYICEICGGRGDKWPVECHEIFAYDDANRVQRLTKLSALCPSCHEVKHLGLAGIRGRHTHALAHLARVNKWSNADAELYVEACFELWHQRSCHEWKLDLTYLEQFGIPAHTPSER
ncbi:MAG: HNH endonuclease [Pyrinomonadaceae bacterium]